jgi:hypothetical protein
MGKNNVLEKNLRRFTVEEKNKRVSGSRFEWATLIRTPSRKVKSFNRKLADSTPGVAPNAYRNPC